MSPATTVDQLDTKTHGENLSGANFTGVSEILWNTEYA